MNTCADTPGISPRHLRREYSRWDELPDPGISHQFSSSSPNSGKSHRFPGSSPPSDTHLRLRPGVIHLQDLMITQIRRSRTCGFESLSRTRVLWTWRDASSTAAELGLRHQSAANARSAIASAPPAASVPLAAALPAAASPTMPGRAPSTPETSAATAGATSSTRSRDVRGTDSSMTTGSPRTPSPRSPPISGP